MDAEDVGDGALEVVAVQPGDKHFAFLVEDEDAANHSEGRMGGGQGDRDTGDNIGGELVVDRKF